MTPFVGCGGNSVLQSTVLSSTQGHWHLNELWSGNLRQAMTAAESTCEAVVAGAFRVDMDIDDDDL